MFDEKIMDKILKIIIKIREIKGYLKSINVLRYEIFIVPSFSSDRKNINDKLHYITEFLDIQPKVVTFKDLDKDSRLFNNVEDFAAIYIMFDQTPKFDLDQLKKNLQLEQDKKHQILKTLETVKNSDDVSCIMREFKIIEYGIELIQNEIKRLSSSE